jgi:protein-tyrosine sulfotransferase
MFYFDFDKVLDSSALFIYHNLKNRLRKADIFCVKEPMLIRHITRLNQIFPRSKILVMVRDGRASSYSLSIKRKEIDQNKTFMDYLNEWNTMYRTAYKECRSLGFRSCKIVKYEDLVKKTEQTMKSVSDFLNIEFTSEFLNHEKYIGSRIILEKNGWSSDQVNRSIYMEALESWVGKVAYSKYKVFRKIDMLRKFGYKVNFWNKRDGKKLAWM